jgi:hypothetical protein
MVVVGLIQEGLALLNSLLGHFVSGSVSSITLGPDFEWAVGVGGYQTTSKGNYLMGAVADIATYGAILVDWIVQALLGNGLNVNAAPT